MLSIHQKAIIIYSYILGIDSSLHGYKFIFETLLDTEKYKNLIEGDFAIDDVVFSPGCL